MKRLINLTGWLISIVLLVVIFINSSHSKKQSAKYYYINIPDSPHIKGAWKELDYISNDTAYYNWYWRE